MQLHTHNDGDLLHLKATTASQWRRWTARQGGFNDPLTVRQADAGQTILLHNSRFILLILVHARPCTIYNIKRITRPTTSIRASTYIHICTSAFCLSCVCTDTIYQYQRIIIPIDFYHRTIEYNYRQQRVVPLAYMFYPCLYICISVCLIDSYSWTHIYFTHRTFVYMCNNTDATRAQGFCGFAITVQCPSSPKSVCTYY